MTYLNKINNQPDLHLSADSLDFETLESIHHLTAKIEKVIFHCLKPLTKLYGKSKATLRAKVIGSILSLKDKSLASLQLLTAKISKVVTCCFEVIKAFFQNIIPSPDFVHRLNIENLRAIDPTISSEGAEEILDFGKFVISFSALMYNWEGSAPTSENKIEHSHVMKGAYNAFIIERKHLASGGGKIVNEALVGKVDLIGRVTFEKVAVMRPVYRPNPEDILREERHVQSLGLSNRHLESKALYTGKTYDRARDSLIEKHRLNDPARDPNIEKAREALKDLIPLSTDFMVKPYLKPFDQLRTAKNGLQALLDITKSISYLHKHDIVHRDIKPDNMMYTDKGNGKISAKLIDLGQLHNINNNSDNVFLGTGHFIAPEIESSKIHTKASDMYAFGRSIQRMIETTPTAVLDEMKSLAIRLTDADPTMRPTATQT